MLEIFLRTFLNSWTCQQQHKSAGITSVSLQSCGYFSVPQLSYVRVCVNLSACVWACGVSVDAVPVWVGRGYLVSSGSQEHITYIRCIPAVSVSVTEEQGHELMEQNNILKRPMLLKDPRRHQNHPRVPANSLNGALVETETSPSHIFILQGFKTII